MAQFNLTPTLRASLRRTFRPDANLCLTTDGLLSGNTTAVSLTGQEPAPDARFAREISRPAMDALIRADSFEVTADAVTITADGQASDIPSEPLTIPVARAASFALRSYNLDPVHEVTTDETYKGPFTALEKSRWTEDDEWPVLTHVNYCSDGATGTWVSTDRYRVARFEERGVTPTGAREADVNIPGAVFAEAARRNGAVLTVYERAARVIVPALNLLILGASDIAQFPAVERLLSPPRTADWVGWEVEPAAGVSAINAVTSRRNTPLTITADGTVYDDESGASAALGDQVHCDEGGPDAVRFSARFLGDLLRAGKAGLGRVEILAHSTVKPAYITFGRDSRVRVMLMPIRPVAGMTRAA